ncbi:ComEA family DNA-binding protein [Tomitella fengzijianii]|uniref:ComEA family DNA-binding protein n=2 Tax=Tomitella fengzijianii TaxID=2597660 RepID=A0A516X8E1_9ACTN|nr:ComEA family DNA-binding protein [Tomitella fengzijianii]
MDRLAGVTSGRPAAGGPVPRPAWLRDQGIPGEELHGEELEDQRLRDADGGAGASGGGWGGDQDGHEDPVLDGPGGASRCFDPNAPEQQQALVRNRVAADARESLRGRVSARLPERWRGTRFAVSSRGAAVLAAVGLLAAVAAGVGVLRDHPAEVRVPEVQAATVALEGTGPGESGAGPEGGRTEEPAGTPPAGAEPSSGAAAPVPDRTAPAGERAAAAPEEIVVSVQGLVQRSGLVRLERGARVADALSAAGGPTDGADLLSLNLAQRLDDGDQVLVGVAPTDGGAPRLGSATISAGAAGPAVGAPSEAGAGAATGTPVDLNAADKTALEALPGIGPVTAESILQWRAQNGRFSSVDQLTEVRGIGPATLERLRDAVTV